MVKLQFSRTRARHALPGVADEDQMLDVRGNPGPAGVGSTLGHCEYGFGSLGVLLATLPSRQHECAHLAGVQAVRVTVDAVLKMPVRPVLGRHQVRDGAIRCCFKARWNCSVVTLT